MESTSGVKTATVVLFWVAAAISGVLALVAFRRKSIWTGYINQTKSAMQANRVDRLFAAITLVQALLLIAAAIVLCIWSKRVAANAVAKGAAGVRPGLAAGGWFIPIGWYWVGFGQLRKSVKGVNKVAPSLLAWQVLFLIQSIVSFFARAGGRVGSKNRGNIVVDVPSTSSLKTSAVVAALSFVLLLAASFFAMRAIGEIDTAVNAD
jgi:hypothetical protein